MTFQHSLNPWHYFAPTTALKRRKETIIDDAPKPRQTTRLNLRRSAKRVGRNCMVLCTPPKRQLAMSEVSSEQSMEKRLREVPSSAPRLVETKGKYTFRKDIRIRDYYIPPRRTSAPSPWSSAYQCRDGFEPHDAASPKPRSMQSPSELTQISMTGHSSSVSTAESESLGGVPGADGGGSTTHPTFIQVNSSNRRCGTTRFSSPIIKSESDDGFQRWLAQGSADLNGGRSGEHTETAHEER